MGVFFIALLFTLLFALGVFLQWVQNNTTWLHAHLLTISNGSSMISAKDGDMLHVFSDLSTSLRNMRKNQSKAQLNLDESLTAGPWPAPISFELRKVVSRNLESMEVLDQTITQVGTHVAHTQNVLEVVESGLSQLERDFETAPWLPQKLNAAWWTGLPRSEWDMLFQDDFCEVLGKTIEGIASLSGLSTALNRGDPAGPVSIRSNLVKLWHHADTMHQAARSIYISTGTPEWRAKMLAPSVGIEFLGHRAVGFLWRRHGDCGSRNGFVNALSLVLSWIGEVLKRMFGAVLQRKLGL